MSRAVLLDAGPLGLLTNPRQTPDVLACNECLENLLTAGRVVLVPEIADYEVRRELVRAGKTAGLAKLDELADRVRYLPITTAAMRRAAELWADARRQGKPTAGTGDIDGDVILAAQALTLGGDVVVATVNVGHLSRYVPAAVWEDIA